MSESFSRLISKTTINQKINPDKTSRAHHTTGKPHMCSPLWHADERDRAKETKLSQMAYGIVKDFAGNVQEKTVFDLYCGTGTIGQIMAKAGSKKVIGIELVAEAAEAANENAKRNGLENCNFIAGDVLQKVDELEDAPDLIIVDPPRDGIHPKAIGKIIGFGAPEIIYVSCLPTSLARDLQVFQETGYEVKRVRLMDMFPHTVHVETIVLLQKAKQAQDMVIE